MKKVYLVTKKGLARNTPLLQKIRERCAIVRNPKAAEAIFVLGGDGTMFHAIRTYRTHDLPFFGFNFGHVGFLMNDPSDIILTEIIEGRTQFIDAHMLKADLFDVNDEKIKSELAFNDFYFERTSTQTANIRIKIDGEIYFDPLICDGVIVSTAAGSTAYNASARGEIIPIGTNSMILTGICPMRFYKWHSAQLSYDAHVSLEAIDIKKRPVRFLADGVHIRKVVRAQISYSTEFVQMGFAISQNFREKVMGLQFGGSEQA